MNTLSNPKGSALVEVNVEYIKGNYRYKKLNVYLHENQHVLYAGPYPEMAPVIENILTLRNTMRLKTESRRGLKLLKERANSLYFKDNGITHIIIYEKIK